MTTEPAEYLALDLPDDPEALVGALLTDPFQTDPYPFYNRLRTLAPVYRSESGLWFASEYAACETLFRSPAFGVASDSVTIPASRTARRCSSWAT